MKLLVGYIGEITGGIYWIQASFALAEPERLALLLLFRGGGNCLITQVCFALKPLTHSLTSGCITLPAVQEDSDEDSDCEYDHDDCGGGGGGGEMVWMVVVVKT